MGSPAGFKPWPIEVRILQHLDQQGGTAHREQVVFALAKPGSRIGDGIANGSNSRVPQLMAAWSRRLVHHGLVEPVYGADGFYKHHRITDHGRSWLRHEYKPDA